ncbi:MAG: thioredoxin [Candidatus Buchananbacteria bacterium]|nr:thioredoxin [Candidatus Buchananbacteria bacterium]
MAELTFTDENFSQEVLNSPVPVLVDFWAPWCGPCKMQGPIIEELAREYEGKNIKIGKLNVDEAPNAASRFQVMSIPTLMIFRNGQPIGQMIGVQDKNTLASKLQELTQ